MNDLAVKLALPARWLVIAGIAYTLATSVLYFLSPPATAPQRSDGVGASVPGAGQPVDVNQILARNLFGAASAESAPVEDTTPAVVTRLPLELLGVFVADAAENSAAIIAQRGKPGILYRVGEDVPGNATLVEVNSNQVVLRRAGVRETLPFPSASEGLASRTPDANPQTENDASDGAYQETYDESQNDPTAGSTEAQPAVSAREMVAAYRERLEQDPAAVLEELGVKAVSDGAAEGYRVDDLAQSPYLGQTGLQPGDVILSINGRPVGDLNQDRLELDNVLARGSARLEVQRGTRRFFVTASLQ